MSNKQPKFEAFRRMRDRSESPAALDDHPVDGIVRPRAGDTVNLPVEHIQPNPNQPRKHFDLAKLEELAQSIKAHGLLQPVLVKATEDPGRYLLVAGERRFRAAKQAGVTHLKAVITDGDEEELALIENLQREDLRAIEEAEALARLSETHRYTQDQLARVVGKSRVSVNESLTLLGLPETIKAECRTSDIAPKSQLLQVVREKSPEKQLALWVAIRDGRMTVRDVRTARKGTPEKPKNHSERFTVNDQRATVTVTFRKSAASDEEVIAALEHAIAAVRRRTSA